MEQTNNPAAAPVLTDWIPCTTPPVREGEYDVEYTGTGRYWGNNPFRARYANGVWTNVTHGWVCDAIADVPHEFRWRGVRRWVLTVRDFLNGERTYVAHVSRRGVLYLTDKLHAPYGSLPHSEALSFDTEAEAVAYATKHARHLKGWKAVQP